MEERRLKKIENEEWRYVPDTNEKYMVSSYGRVKSFTFKSSDGRIMKPCKMGNFLALKLKNTEGKMVNWYIHKLVAEVFIPKESEELDYVVHVDLNYKNNQISNLKWTTKDEVFANVRKRNKLSGKRKKPVNTKLTENDVAVLKAMSNKGVTNVEIAKLFCISEMQVTRIKRGENWGHVKPAENI